MHDKEDERVRLECPYCCFTTSGADHFRLEERLDAHLLEAHPEHYAVNHKTRPQCC